MEIKQIINLVDLNNNKISKKKYNDDCKWASG